MPYNQYHDFLEEFKFSEDKFIITGKSNVDIRTKDTYSYAAVKYNLSTPFGWDLIEGSYRDYKKNRPQKFPIKALNKITD